jgi:hypothetical protein
MQLAMSNPPVGTAKRPDANVSKEVLSEEIDRRLSLVSESISEGHSPTVEDLDILERLSRIKSVAFPTNNDRQKRKAGIIALCVAVSLLLMAAYIRLPATAVELDVYVRQLNCQLASNGSGYLIPGEMGELVALRRVSIFGADDIDPPSIGEGGNLKLELPPHAGSDLAIRFQELALGTASTTLQASVAYAPGLTGLVLATAGNHLSVARLGKVISLEGPLGKQKAIQPVRASGKSLRIELFPIDADRQFTILRDASISDLSFESGSRSSLLRGVAIVKSLSQDRTLVQPGDRLELRSDRPLLIRELTLSKGEIHATISSAHATVIRLGDDPPLNLMPTIFEWARLRWPTQVYATLSALVALWFAFHRFWENSK